MLKRWRRKVRLHFHQVIKTKTSPASIAWGFSIGSFIAIMPTPGISVGIGILLVLIFPQLSKIALFLAMLIWNPFTIYPFYVLSFQLGTWLFGGGPVMDMELTFFEKISNYTVSFLLGNVMVAGLLAGISYFIIYILVKKYRAMKLKKWGGNH